MLSVAAVSIVLISASSHDSHRAGPSNLHGHFGKGSFHAMSQTDPAALACLSYLILRFQTMNVTRCAENVRNIGGLV